MHDISKTAAAVKLDIVMVHHQSCKPIYFTVKRSEVKVTVLTISLRINLPNFVQLKQYCIEANRDHAFFV